MNWSHVCVISVIEGKEKEIRTEEIFGEVMIVNLSNILKEII